MTLFSAEYECELDGFTCTIESGCNEYIPDSELKCEGFAAICRELGIDIEWLGDGHTWKDETELWGNSLERFKRMSFKVLSRSES